MSWEGPQKHRKNVITIPCVIRAPGTTHYGARHNPNFSLFVPVNLIISKTKTLKNTCGRWVGVGVHFIFLMADFKDMITDKNQAAWYNNLLLTPCHTTINRTFMSPNHSCPFTTHYVQHCRTVVHFTVSFKTHTAKGYLEYKYIIFYYCLFHTALYNQKHLHTLHKDLKSFLSKATTFETITNNTGDHGGTVVKVLCYKLEGHWFDPNWCHRNFSMT